MNKYTKNPKKKSPPPAYQTLALAEKAHVSKLNTATPSEENVEETKKWSEENKL